MENYNRRTTALLRRQGGELQSIVAMIAETAVKLGGENTRSAQRLQEIGNRFERAGALDDLRALKAHLGDCLTSFREETRRQKAESDTAINSLQQEIERRSLTAGAVADLDPVTGLPRHASALRVPLVRGTGSFRNRRQRVRNCRPQPRRSRSFREAAKRPCVTRVLHRSH
jgi:hypothetical protein